MPRLLPAAVMVAAAGLLAGCVATPTPQYQPAIANTELLLRQQSKLSVGDFSAGTTANNHGLGLRGSKLEGGRDGTFSTYLRDAAITELRTAGCYDENSPIQLSGVLIRNELNAAIKTGTATVGAEFVLTQAGTSTFKKTVVAQHQWESSFMGAMAIPFAMDNYTATVQKLLGMLFADPAFVAAARGRSNSR